MVFTDEDATGDGDGKGADGGAEPVKQNRGEPEQEAAKVGERVILQRIRDHHVDAHRHQDDSQTRKRGKQPTR